MLIEDKSTYDANVCHFNDMREYSNKGVFDAQKEQIKKLANEKEWLVSKLKSSEEAAINYTQEINHLQRMISGEENSNHRGKKQIADLEDENMMLKISLESVQESREKESEAYEQKI